MPSKMFLENAMCFFGTLCAFYLFLKCVKFVLEVLKTTFLRGSIDFTRFGEWAAVTGCTDGIGKAYAKQLAAKGLNIVLIGRTKKKLDDVASEIEEDFKVKTKIVQADLSGGHEIYDRIAKELEGFEIGVLVNCAGVAFTTSSDGIPPYPARLHEHPQELLWSQVNVNALSAVMLSALFVPGMYKRKKGVIINVSSASAVLPGGFIGAYSGTKACVVKFCESLHMEYADSGIIVQSVIPMFVSTKMNNTKTTSLFCPTPDDYVRSVLKKVGVTLTCYGYWPHELQIAISSLVPRWLLLKLIANYLRGLREEALKMKNKQKKL